MTSRPNPNTPARVWQTQRERENKSTGILWCFLVAVVLLLIAPWLTEQAVAEKLAWNGAVFAGLGLLVWINRYVYDVVAER